VLVTVTPLPSSRDRQNPPELEAEAASPKFLAGDPTPKP
jgi:hypothetical protein